MDEPDPSPDALDAFATLEPCSRRSRMSLRVFRPSAPLAPYVSAIWDYDDLLGGENLGLSILPDTATYLCFLYDDPLTTRHKDRVYTTRSGLAGFQSFRSDLGGMGSVSGVSARLTPWGLNVFRRGIARDCAESRVDCRFVFPKYTVEEIEDRLARQRTAEERVRYIERFLLSIIKPDQEDRLIQAACRALDRSHGSYRIGKLAAALGTTARTLERRFHAHVGARPKKYARVVRLRHALLQRPRLSSWADVAYTTGYYDQSHMIKEFQELYGLAPESVYPRMEGSRTFRFSGLLDLSRPALPTRPA
jgi:AraC-like DNA-binding protein